MRWNTLGATPTAPNTVIEKFPKLCTASSCGLSPKSYNQVEVQLWNHGQTQMGKCTGQSHTLWRTFLSQSATAWNPLFCSVWSLATEILRQPPTALGKSPKEFFWCVWAQDRIYLWGATFCSLLLNKDQTEVCWCFVHVASAVAPVNCQQSRENQQKMGKTPPFEHPHLGPPKKRPLSVGFLAIWLSQRGNR